MQKGIKWRWIVGHSVVKIVHRMTICFLTIYFQFMGLGLYVQFGGRGDGVRAAKGDQCNKLGDRDCETSSEKTSTGLMFHFYGISVN
jgi:hypothetical protein